MNKDQIATLDLHFTSWEVVGQGLIRYQATPRGSIIGFYGYAADYEEAYANLMSNAAKDNHNNCSYCAAGEAYNHNPEEVRA